MKGSELEFISKISNTGRGTEPFPNNLIGNNILMEEEFELKQLCIKEETYIAHGIGTYAVRIKKEPAIPKTIELTPAQKIQEILDRTKAKINEQAKLDL